MMGEMGASERHRNHTANEEQPSAKSQSPQENSTYEETDNRQSCDHIQYAGKPPIRKVPKRHTAIERGNRQQVKQPEQRTRAGKPVRAERVRECSECKAGRRSSEADRGTRARRRRQAAPQDSAADGQAQFVHRAAGQPDYNQVSALVHGGRQQENGEHAGCIRAPERGQQHEKAIADLNPAHSAR